MGKRLIIKRADFSANAVDVASTWVNNDFNWGKGGISQAGKTTGSTNHTMSMLGKDSSNGYTLAQHTTVLRASNGYKIHSYILSTTQVRTGGAVDRSTYHAMGNTPSDWIDELQVNKGMYYEIAIAREDLTNADITQGDISLLICEDDD